MSGHQNPETQKLILFVGKAPFTDELKTKFLEMLSTDGITEEAAQEIHDALSKLTVESFNGDWQHAKFNMDLTGILKQWRLSQGSKKFKRSR
ncbi:MAG: hypothetical protein NTZ74_16180 [Chloroflexi bacterium]|nr:hypothetical protein [Chloroflexota bacterium]